MMPRASPPKCIEIAKKTNQLTKTTSAMTDKTGECLNWSPANKGPLPAGWSDIACSEGPRQRVALLALCYGRDRRKAITQRDGIWNPAFKTKFDRKVGTSGATNWF